MRLGSSRYALAYAPRHTTPKRYGPCGIWSCLTSVSLIFPGFGGTPQPPTNPGRFSCHNTLVCELHRQNEPPLLIMRFFST